MIEGGSPFTAIDFAHDGFSILAGDARGNLYEYDLRNTVEPLSAVKSAHERSVTCVRFPTNPNPPPAVPASLFVNRQPPAPVRAPIVETPSEESVLSPLKSIPSVAPTLASVSSPANILDPLQPRHDEAIEIAPSRGLLSPLGPLPLTRESPTLLSPPSNASSLTSLDSTLFSPLGSGSQEPYRRAVDSTVRPKTPPRSCP